MEQAAPATSLGGAMKVFGIAGYSGSGKTTLLEKLIPQFTARGLKVSVIKHAHHGFDIDRPGKDSYRHREAGASEVLLSCNDRWALMHERRDESDVTLDELLARLAPCDLVLIEGFKQEPIPKLEVYRPENGKPPLFPERSDIVAVATDAEIATSLPRLALDDVAAIAGFVMTTLQLQERPC
jgi:molybdopterin-guanine dinucleotide biosynthesis protein B